MASALGHDPAVLLPTYAHAIPDHIRFADVFTRTVDGTAAS